MSKVCHNCSLLLHFPPCHCSFQNMDMGHSTTDYDIRGGTDSKGAREFGPKNGFWANIRVYKLDLNGTLIVRPASHRGCEVR